MITIDGSEGEGGGQILRSSLALSLVTGEPFRMRAIRARRSRPGLLRQHLTALDAARTIAGAEVDGAALGSSEITFRPGRVAPGAYSFAVGSAGSATLVLQTILAPLVLAGAPSDLAITGGTHNPMAPPFPFLASCYAKILARMGVTLALTLDKAGFYPAGGGAMRASIQPGSFGALTLLDRGAIVSREVRALVADVPAGVAKREIDALLAALGWSRDEVDARPEDVRSEGPGNALVVTLTSEHVTEVFVGFGERGVRAEAVGERVAAEIKRYLAAGVPVGEHLADQLMLPMALGEGGAYRTLAPSKHATTHAEVIHRFLGTRVRFTPDGDDRVVVTVPPRPR